jgi:hypothetical protein
VGAAAAREGSCGPPRVGRAGLERARGRADRPGRATLATRRADHGRADLHDSRIG